MLKDVPETGQTPYFIYTTISEKNLLVYMNWHSEEYQSKHAIILSEQI